MSCKRHRSTCQCAGLSACAGSFTAHVATWGLRCGRVAYVTNTSTLTPLSQPGLSRYEHAQISRVTTSAQGYALLSTPSACARNPTAPVAAWLVAMRARGLQCKHTNLSRLTASARNLTAPVAAFLIAMRARGLQYKHINLSRLTTSLPQPHSPCRSLARHDAGAWPTMQTRIDRTPDHLSPATPQPLSQPASSRCGRAAYNTNTSTFHT